jgi:hypothetical protein
MNLTHLIHSFIAVAIAVSTAIAAAPPVALDIRGQSGAAPFSTRARVSLEPDTANRYLCLQWVQVQGGTQERTSCQSLDAERAPKTHWQLLKDLSSGKWDVVAYVIRNDEQARLSNRITLHVLGPNYESEPEQ